MKRNLWKLMIVLALVICVLPMAAFAEGEGEPFQCPKHQWIKTEDTATCGSGGTSSWLCTVPGCGLTTSEPSPVNPNNHAGQVTVSEVPAQCGIAGEVKYSCSCGAQTWTKSIGALSHNWDEGVVVKAATCTEAGSKEYTCQNTGCPLGKVTQDYNALGHDWDDGVGTNAICGTAGQKRFTCARDNSHTKTETYPALRHNWDEGVVVKAATCTEKGSKYYTCQNPGCPLGNVTQAYDALGHAWDEGKVTKAATCSAKGVKTYTCTRSSAHTKTEDISATGAHKLSSMVYDKSQHWQYCMNSGCKYIVSAFHEFSNWRVARKATEEKDGVLRKDCAYCSQKLWSSYEYSDNPKTDDPLVPMMALLLASAVLLPMTLRYTRRKWKYWV